MQCSVAASMFECKIWTKSQVDTPHEVLMEMQLFTSINHHFTITIENLAYVLEAVYLLSKHYVVDMS